MSFLSGSVVKNLPAMQETQVPSLGQEDPLEEEMTGLLFPPPGDLPDSGIKPTSPALQADSLPSDPPGKPMNTGVGSLSFLQGSPDTPSELVLGNRNKE